MKFSELYRLLEKDGWVLKKQGAKHARYAKPGHASIPVGRHPAREVPTGTLKAIQRETGLK
jgi:predicted RNA binding protein YcfA (HicA-like mRNA interferase family)